MYHNINQIQMLNMWILIEATQSAGVIQSIKMVESVRTEQRCCIKHTKTQTFTHLLSQGPGTDGTWLWVQPSSRLVLGLEQRNLYYLFMWDRTTGFGMKSLNELGKDCTCFVVTIKCKLPSPDWWDTETGPASFGVETWPPPGRSGAWLCSAPPGSRTTEGRGQECSKNSYGRILHPWKLSATKKKQKKTKQDWVRTRLELLIPPWRACSIALNSLSWAKPAILSVRR